MVTKASDLKKPRQLVLVGLELRICQKQWKMIEPHPKQIRALSQDGGPRAHHAQGLINMLLVRSLVFGYFHLGA